MCIISTYTHETPRLTRYPIPPRGVELPHSTTGNNEKSIEGGAESGADQPETDELVDLLDSMTPEQREALIALIRTKK